MNLKIWRVGGGIAVLVLLGLMIVRLYPPYLENWKLQRFINELAADPQAVSQPPEVIRARIVNQAASLGLPVRSSEVRVTKSQAAFKIEVLYLVHVDLAAYSVDLHFRPAAGGT